MDGARKLMGFDWQYGVADVPARDAFSCRGENETEFYRQDARRYSHIGAACVVTVWADDSHDKVAGFVSYAPSAINADRPKVALQNRMGMDYDTGKRSFPCWLIGQLARSEGEEFKGLGAALVRFAVMDIARRAHHGAGGCIVIDVFEPDLIAFYRDEIGFRVLHPSLDEWNKLYRSGNRPRMMMYMPISKAAEWAARAGLMPL